MGVVVLVAQLLPRPLPGIIQIPLGLIFIASFLAFLVGLITKGDVDLTP
jgi:hypothetical protein